MEKNSLSFKAHKPMQNWHTEWWAQWKGDPQNRGRLGSPTKEVLDQSVEQLCKKTRRYSAQPRKNNCAEGLMTYEYSRVVFVPGCYNCWLSGASPCIFLLQDNFRTLDYLTNSNISENVLGNGQCHIDFGENKKMKGEKCIYAQRLWRPAVS